MTSRFTRTRRHSRRWEGTGRGAREGERGLGGRYVRGHGAGSARDGDGWGRDGAGWGRDGDGWGRDGLRASIPPSKRLGGLCPFAVSVLNPSRREDGASDSDETPSDSDETPSDSDAFAVSVLDPSRFQRPLSEAPSAAPILGLRRREDGAAVHVSGSDVAGHRRNSVGLRRDRTQTKLRRTQK